MCRRTSDGMLVEKPGFKNGWIQKQKDGRSFELSRKLVVKEWNGLPRRLDQRQYGLLAILSSSGQKFRRWRVSSKKILHVSCRGQNCSFITCFCSFMKTLTRFLGQRFARLSCRTRYSSPVISPCALYGSQLPYWRPLKDQILIGACSWALKDGELN